MIDQARTREVLCYICWKEQSAQQYGAVWTTGNHLPVVYTSIES